MVKRILTATPKEILAMNSRELLEAIRISEGRTIIVQARPRGPNIVDYVSNAELAAAFGADIVHLDTYDFHNPYVPGLPSKNLEDDVATKPVQITLGRGWTLREIRKLIGRPVAIALMSIPKDMLEGLVKTYGNILATKENARLAVEQGTDLIAHFDFGPEIAYNVLRDIREEVGDKAILSYMRVHGTGLMGYKGYISGKNLIAEDEIPKIIDSGADIIGLPAPGTCPGWTIEHANKMVEIIHKKNALASLGIYTSQEGTDAETIRRIALYAKMAGADIFEIADAGINESMPPPENILALSIVIRGRRHTYRRMAMSILR